jgi:hypothetical protein
LEETQMPVLNDAAWLSIAELTGAFGVLNEVRDAEAKMAPDEFNEKHGECEAWIAEIVGELIACVQSGSEPAARNQEDN